MSDSTHWSVSMLAVGAASFLVLTALTTTVVFFATPGIAREVVEQPFLFNHDRHVTELGLDCADCHQGCREGVGSGFPAVAGCALCHSEPQGDTAAERDLVAHIAAGTPVQWRPLFRQPAHVFFSHRRHTTVAELDCTECHGDIGHSTAPPTRSAPLSMARCISCHEERGAPADCSTCHR